MVRFFMKFCTHGNEGKTFDDCMAQEADDYLKYMKWKKEDLYGIES